MTSERPAGKVWDKVLKWWAIITTITAVVLGLLLKADRLRGQLIDIIPRVEAIECNDRLQDMSIRELKVEMENSKIAYNTMRKENTDAHNFIIRYIEKQ